MKKTFYIVSGLLFLASTIIPFSNASRDAYHSYLMQKVRQEREDDKKIYRPFADSKNYGGNTTKGQGGRFWRNSMRRELNFSPLSNKKKEEVATGYNYDNYRLSGAHRRSTNRISTAWKSALRKKRGLTFNKINDAVSKFDTYENQTFSIQIPQGWESSKTKPHFFESSIADFTISIEKLEEACSNISFTTCAIALSQNSNRNDDIDNISTITRQTQFSNTVLGNEIQTRTFMEGFAANIYGKKIYVSRFYVTDISGGVYVIKTRSDLDVAANFLGVSKVIFDSFRMFP